MRKEILNNWWAGNWRWGWKGKVTVLETRKPNSLEGNSVLFLVSVLHFCLAIKHCWFLRSDQEGKPSKYIFYIKCFQKFLTFQNLHWNFQDLHKVAPKLKFAILLITLTFCLVRQVCSCCTGVSYKKNSIFHPWKHFCF